MSQPYGQQPGDSGQGFGGMPPAPQEYTAGPVTRPGTVTAAAVLAFVQAGITLICAIITMGILGAVSDANNTSVGGMDVNVDGGVLTMLWILTILSIAGSGALIWAGVQAIGGKSGNLLVIVSAAEIVLSIIWLVMGFGIFPILLAIMPIISLILMLGAPAKQFVASRRGPA
jgi:hypothetical protein